MRLGEFPEGVAIARPSPLEQVRGHASTLPRAGSFLFGHSGTDTAGHPNWADRRHRDIRDSTRTQVAAARPVPQPAGVCIVTVGTGEPTQEASVMPDRKEQTVPNPRSLLQDKCAVVFGGGGSIGAAVAREFAAEGAEVFLAGHNHDSVEVVAKQIIADGGRAHSAQVDALDAAVVDAFIESVVRQAGRLDIEFNAVGPRVHAYGNGKPATDLLVEEFMTAVDTVVRTQFTTARAAARRMVKQRSGVIIFLTGSPARPHTPGTTGIGAAFGAVENVMRTMALELGPARVRSVCVRTAANPDTRTMRETADVLAAPMQLTSAQVLDGLAQGTMLKTSPTTSDTAKAAAFVASDRAHMITGTVLNASAGAVTD